MLIHTAHGALHLSVRSVDAGDDATANLVLVHDMSFIERRSTETRRYLFYFFVVLGLCVALITVVIAQLSWRGWVQGLRALLRGEGILRPATAPPPELRPIQRDLKELIRDLERQYRPLDGSQRIWDQQALRATLRSELHGRGRHRRLEPRAVHPRAAMRVEFGCSGRRADSSRRWNP